MARGKNRNWEQVDRNRSDLKVVDEPVVGQRCWLLALVLALAQAAWRAAGRPDAVRGEGRLAADISSNRFLCLSLFRLRRGWAAQLFFTCGLHSDFQVRSVTGCDVTMPASP